MERRYHRNGKKHKKGNKEECDDFNNRPTTYLDTEDLKKVVVNQTVHLLFVDLEKVYDSVPLNRLWETMKKINASAWG